jgi:putative transposase
MYSLMIHDVPREYELRKHPYAHLKAAGLGAQAAQHVIKKVPRRVRAA